MTTKKSNKQDLRDPSTKRLDCIIRLLGEALRSMDKNAFNDRTISQMLYSAGLTPSEIAQVLGKKSGQDINQYLYSQKK